MQLPSLDVMPLEHVTDLASLNRFLERIDHLHDAGLKEAAFAWRGYVDDSFSMYGDADGYDAVLVFQTQNSENPVVELRCRDVSTFRIDVRFDFDVQGEITPNGFSLFYADKDPSQSYRLLEAAELAYRILGKEYLGEGLKLLPRGIIPS